jgi:hypothetical protein
MTAWKGGTGALHAAATGSLCTHTTPHPSPANPCTAPSSPAGLACNIRGHEELRGEVVGFGAWRTRAAWHTSVLVPTAPIRPLHQTVMGSIHLQPSFMQLTFGSVACTSFVLCSRSTAPCHHPFNASCQWAVTLASVPVMQGATANRRSSAYHVAGILSCGHALAGALSTSCAMQQPIISRTPLELQAGVWHAHGMCPVQRQYSALSASPALIPLAWTCTWLLLLPAHPHTVRVM